LAAARRFVAPATASKLAGYTMGARRKFTFALT